MKLHRRAPDAIGTCQIIPERAIKNGRCDSETR